MKSIGQFSLGLEQLESHAFFSQLCCIYPEGKHARSFFVELPTNDERFIALQEFLVRSGYKFTDTFRLETPRSIMLRIYFEYEASDFGEHSWYVIYPSRSLSEYPSRNPEGLLRNLGDHDYLLSDSEVEALQAGEIEIEELEKRIPEWAKDGLSTAGGYAILMGVEFANSIASRGLSVPTKPTESVAMVEWSPRLVFPRLSARCQFCDPKGNVIALDGDRSYGHLRDGYVQNPNLKYDQEALIGITDRAGMDDVAKSFECFGNAPKVSEPKLLVSERLAEWLIEHDDTLRWQPVEIE
ncbi:MAG: hypothetical protein ACK5OB_10235 [Pirellula sp.]